MIKDDGFTLVEMLVSLLVLSFAAVILTSTLSSAFLNYETVTSTRDRVQNRQYLQNTLTELSASLFSSDRFGPSNHLETVLFENGAKLSIHSGNYKSQLVFTDTEQSTYVIWEDERLLRLERTSVSNPINGTASFVINPTLSLVAIKTTGTETIAQAALVVTLPSNCQYDVVGLQCR